MKYVSILGDSVSTFEGYNPSGYSVFYDNTAQERNGLQSVYDTWWAKVIRVLQANLCVNDAYSGSRVSGKDFPAGNSERRINNLRLPEVSPDLILICLGFNDYGYGVPLRKDGGNGTLQNDPRFFEDAYDIMLKRVKYCYPDAAVVCGTMMHTRLRQDSEWVFPKYYGGLPYDEYINVIRKSCGNNQCLLADLNSLGRRYETLDGAHPTAFGHQMIADAWLQCLNQLGLLGADFALQL